MTARRRSDLPLSRARHSPPWVHHPRAVGGPIEWIGASRTPPPPGNGDLRGPRRGRGWLGFERRQRRAAGIRPSARRLEAGRRSGRGGRAAADLRGAVAVKALGPEIVHKTELGGARARPRGSRQAAEAAVRIDERLELAGLARERFLVQAMAAGVEMLLGVVGDPLFGPVVAWRRRGRGGADQRRLGTARPLTTRDAQEMLRGLKTFPLLTGYRGSPVVDVDALQDLPCARARWWTRTRRSPSSTSTR